MDKQLEKDSSRTQFVKRDGEKSKSNAIDIPSISLPKGGGAIKGVDEKFSVNAVNGSASFSIPLPFSSVRGASPALSLSYNSGTGNSVFGLGWQLELNSIKRKTAKGLPKYVDGKESDTFLFASIEDLVPELKKDDDGVFQTDSEGEYIDKEKDSPDGLYQIRYYKPRIEGSFIRIERWTEKHTGIIKWRTINGDNLTTLYGWSENSVISNPENDTKIFEWLPEFMFDDRGNCSHFVYKKEDEAGFDSALLHNKNRLNKGNITYTNCYLEKVLYGNKTPYKNFGDAFPSEDNYLFETLFDYGEYDENAPYSKLNEWGFRDDAFSDYKAGFEIRTTRLCKRVLLFHHFAGENEYDGLVKSVDFTYDTTIEKDFTFLKHITARGYIKKDDGTYTSKELPTTEFEYQKHDWSKDVKTFSEEDLVHLPSGLDSQQYQFTDLYNEGLSGILTEQAGAWYYKHNLGDGNFEQAKLITPKPSFIGLGTQVQLLDLESDGKKQIVSYDSESKGYFEINGDNYWQNFRNFESISNINLTDPNTRLLDLNGDGKPDVLITEDSVFTYYQSKGKKGFSKPYKSIKSFDEEKGPAIIFADDQQTIFLADMSGDGMTDIVRIRNGEICYWANLGYGKFSSKVGMDNSPIFDESDLFDPNYLKIADIDGSGTSDVIYLGKNKFSCWLNLSGNKFTTEPFEIGAFPEINDQTEVTVTDLLGNGIACIVWSSNLPKDKYAPLRYIDLMNSKKPHIMVSYKNNLGKEVSLEYTPSTKFYIEDKLNGTPWATKLHFPVHCISKTEIIDKISGWRFTSSYKYHHGYYDHEEREFRGFGMVEQIDAEHFENWEKGNASNIVDKELHQEPIVTKSWFHTGAFFDRKKILRQFEDETWHKKLNRLGFEVNHHEKDLPDSPIIPAKGIPAEYVEKLSQKEWLEALRACKNMPLRSEIFAYDTPTSGATDDEIKKQLTPYSVATNNCVIELIQPKGKNKHAVFVVKESESVTYSYERNPEDPRIAHNLNIKLDELGNIIESANVVYPRKVADTSLPNETQQEQNKTVIIYSKNEFTNDVLGDDDNRLRLPSETQIFELKGVNKTDSFYEISDFEDILDNSDTVHYHQLDASPLTGNSQKRLIEHVRTNYYQDDLLEKLNLHELESLALPFESYQLAYTPELLDDIFANKVDDTLLEEGKFTHSEGDNNWWIRSGTTQFTEALEDASHAQDRFYLPISHTDPFGAKTKLKYYQNYHLFIEETEDTLGNTEKVDKFNFRTLSPQRMRDINNNLSESISDELGLVKATAILGKGNEADDLVGLEEFTSDAEKDLIDDFFDITTDSVLLKTIGKNLLKHASARFVYDFDVYANSGKPAVVASIVREEHFQKNNDSSIQIGFEYSHGLGSVIMKKVQAEPGIAKKIIVNDDDTYLITDEDTASLNPTQLRWIGNGRTIINNKGNEVKQYEPYFSVTHHYEDQKELVETGVTSIMFYDAMGRLIKTELPDGTLNKVEFDSWKQTVSDANDTVLESAWYDKRHNHLIDAELTAKGKNPEREKIAADKSAKHADTPNILHFDILGRPVLSIEHNRDIVTDTDEFFETKTKIDTEGNLRTVTDARKLIENSNLGNTVIEYKYDMLGNLVYQNSMDAGQRWLLINILGSPLRTWDERNHEFQYFYDKAHRPTHSKVLGGDGTDALDNIFEKVIYGESLLAIERNNEAALQADNILGQAIKHYDTGGVLLSPEFDFKGQVKFTTRKLFRNYKGVANWTDANLTDDIESGEFTFRTETDALGRITRQIAPDQSIITPSYNETGLLNGETVEHFNPDTTNVYIKDIDYNEKGQRNKIIYGNDVTSQFYYDKETFRLKRLETKRDNGDSLQDWYYTFDAGGNITHIEDKNIPEVFFNNQKITGVSVYTYDALYRLVEARGRENSIAVNFNNEDNWNDAPFMQEMNPGDPIAMRTYTQSYEYDEVGNILKTQHQATSNNWTRNNEYEKTNNRLKTSQIGTETYEYPHHPTHGFITEMPHLEEIGWNFKEELVRTIQQKVNPLNGTAETTYYQYDGKGQRLRKITENSAVADGVPTKKNERIYISGFEQYKEFSGINNGLKRESLSLIDKGNRFVMVETRNDIDDGTEKRLIRYQLHNHIGSASLELNETAQVISYEEYHPFGTTAYQAKNKTIKSAAKRFRYTGMERDEETGLEYHSARYYLPWLGRWLSSDPIGTGDGVNLYAYGRNKPINLGDVSGLQATEEPIQIDNPEEHPPHPRFPVASIPPTHPDGIPRALPPPGQGAEVQADISIPALSLTGRTGFSLILGTDLPGAERRMNLFGSFNLQHPSIPRSLFSISGDITAFGSTSDAAVGTTLPDTGIALSGFSGTLHLQGDLQSSLPGVVGSFSLQEEIGGEDLPTQLSFEGNVGLFSDSIIFPHISMSGTGVAIEDSFSLSGEFSGWATGIMWGNWTHSSSNGFSLSGNYIGLQFGPIGLGGVDPRMLSPESSDAVGIPGFEGTVDTFTPGLSLGYSRVWANLSTGSYLTISAGWAFDASITHNDLSSPEPSLPIFSIPFAGDFLQETLDYYPSTSTPAGQYFGVNVQGAF